MAQVQPSSSNAPPPATNGQSTAPSSNPQQVAPVSWEGDRMFNVYIHDYFLKRGFRKAAKELVVEAEIGNDASPPINARQGFLFEWWSVFWMFFSAKTTGQGPENVMLYFHWIQSQQAERSRQLHENEQRRAVQQLPLTTQPPTRAIARPPPPNGVRPPGMVNGAVPMPQAPGQPASAGQALQYPMSVPHAPMPPSLQQPPSGPGQPQSHINGIVDPSVPHGHAITNTQRSPSQPQQGRPVTHGPLSQLQQGHPPPSHPNTVPHLQASQRQISRGQHDPMRGPGQFHSPTMNPAHPPGPGQQSTLAAHAPMSGIGGAPPQMGTPGAQHLAQHPHIGRGLPPQAGQPNHVSPRNPSQTPTQPYQQLMNHPSTMGHPQAPGSRSATPGSNPIVHQSPAREPPPQTQGQTVNEEMSRRFQHQHQHQQHQHQQHQHQQHQHQQQQHQQQQHHQQQQQQRHSQLQEQQDVLNVEQSLARIPPVFLAQMRMEAGVGDRDISTLSYEEKSRLNVVFKRTMATYNGTAGATNQPRNGRPVGPQQAIPGMPMGPPQGPPGARQHPGPRGQKRTSISPTDEGAGETTQKDQSPPDAKRRRRSPHTPGNETGGAAPPMNSMGGFPPNHPANHPGYPGQQQSMPNGFRPPQGGQIGGPMNPAGGQPVVPNIGGMAMAGMTPGMGHTMPPPGMSHMNPALANQHIPQMPNSQNQQQLQQHYRQTMAVQHLQKMSGGGIGANAGNSGNTNPPSSLDVHDAARAGPGSGGPGAGSRSTQQGKPGSMMPPPSPAHRADNSNTQKGVGMMPPPAQPGGAVGNTGGVSKEQTTPPAGARHEGATGSSPSIRPASSGGAAPSSTAPSGPSSMTQSGAGAPATPASAGGNNNNNATTTAPSPSAVLTSRISPSAAMNSLPRPQTSGSESTTVVNAGSGVPPPPSSAPSSSALPTDLFNNFFDTMEDNFGLDSAFQEAIDPAEFSQWIDMNPLS